MKPYRNVIIGVVGSIIILVLLVVLSDKESPRTQTTNAAGAPSVQTGEANYDFGTISMRAGTVSYAFKITNTSSDPLVVKKLYTSCMCTTATLIVGSERAGPFGMPGHGFIPSIDQTIPPGEEASLEVVFDPTAHGPAGVGRIDRVVTVETSGGPLQFGIKANVTP